MYTTPSDREGLQRPRRRERREAPQRAGRAERHVPRVRVGGAPPQRKFRGARRADGCKSNDARGMPRRRERRERRRRRRLFGHCKRGRHRRRRPHAVLVLDRRPVGVGRHGLDAEERVATMIEGLAVERRARPVLAHRVLVLFLAKPKNRRPLERHGRAVPTSRWLWGPLLPSRRHFARLREGPLLGRRHDGPFARRLEGPDAERSQERRAARVEATTFGRI
mmetsp:Transcript_1294/g.3611  ORF Transcript_1294/g.3611 Transcript_1294/m.3611 type:complete len:222 (-) Transcript_1294:318-983(-)